MSESRFFEQAARLDAVIAAGSPTHEVIENIGGLLTDSSLFNYFLDRLMTADWLGPLKEKGFFSVPPQPVHDRIKGTVSFSRWAASRYLARVAKDAPEKVLEIALQIDTENIRIHEDLIEAALAMPAEFAAKWIKKEIMWINQQQVLYLLMPRELGTLVSHLALGGEVETALDLARTLLAVQPRMEKGEAYRFDQEPLIRFDRWDYEELLKKHIPDLISVAGEKALLMLCEVLDATIRFSRSREKGEGSEDYSYIWRPAIEDHEQNLPFGLRTLLVSAVRDVSEQIIRSHLQQISRIVEKLEARTWRVFHRIALHLLRVFPENSAVLIAERLTDRMRFDAISLRHEYCLLARDCFGNLSTTGQNVILNWIDVGPDLEEFKTWRQKNWDKATTDEEAEQYRKSWMRDRLGPFHASLPLAWRQRYDELVRELGEPEHPEFVSYSSGVRSGPTSPRGTQDLRSMNTVEVIAYLKTWQPSEDPMGPSQEGLGRELTALVASEPERFATDARLFQGLDPTYVRSILRGFHEAIGQRKAFPWESVLSLCQWVEEQPISIAGRNVNAWNADPDWGWTRKTIAGLLATGVQEGTAAIPYEFRNKVWAVLSILTDDLDPTPDDENRSDSRKVEPFNLSINTTRGEAMHAVVRYGLWVRRNIENGPDGKKAIERGLDEMPEVRRVLEDHLNPQREPTLTIRSVYGQWFPWLVLLDRIWVTENLPKIFPRAQELRDLWNAAWGTYITFCASYDNVFDVVRAEYGHAVNQIGMVAGDIGHLGDPDEHLAEHLMTFYWRGKLDLDGQDGLLASFYAKASDQLCGHAIEFIGRSLRDTKEIVPPEILERLRALWLQRMNVARNAIPSSSHHTELAAFSWWFASSRFDDTWAMTQLLEVLKLTGKADPDFLIVERLVEIAEAMPSKAVECLRLIIEGDREGWKIYGRLEEYRSILTAAIQSSDNAARQSAFDLVNYFGARGILDFRDLLPKSSPSGH